MSQEETQSDGDTIECPVCGSSMRDLWEYDFRDSECVDTECDHCEAVLLLTEHISRTYTCRAKLAKQEETP